MAHKNASRTGNREATDEQTPFPESTSIPKYLLDASRPNERTTIDRPTRLSVSFYVQSASSGNTVTFRLWRPDVHGLAQFERLVRETLVNPGHYAMDQLRGWTFEELWTQIQMEMGRASQASDALWKDELKSVYKRALNHKEHWQKRCRETIEGVRDYADARARYGDSDRSPLPYMPDDWRRPEPEDNPWRYLVLGMKMEKVFECRYTFLPEDVDLAAPDLWRHVERPVWYYTHVSLDLREFHAQWLHLQDDLPADLREQGLLSDSPEGKGRAGDNQTKKPSGGKPEARSKQPEGDKSLRVEGVEALFGNTPLDVPAGKVTEVLSTLLVNEGRLTTYKAIGCEGRDPKEADDQTRQAVRKIREVFTRANVPYEIKTVRREGYRLQRKTDRKTKGR